MLIVHFPAYYASNEAMSARFEEADVVISGNPILGDFIAKHPDEARLGTPATPQEIKKAAVMDLGDE